MAITDNLVAYYPADEVSGNLIDAVGALDLTDTNTVGTAAGKIGSARSFVAASSEYFTITNAAFDLGAAAKTFAMWFYPTSTARMWLGGCSSGGNGVYLLAYSEVATPEKVTWYTGNNALASSSTISQNEWHLLVGRHDGSATKSLRVDNVEVTASQAGSASTSAFTIGRAGAEAIYANGRIDEIGLWSRVISDAECDTLWNSGAGVGLFAAGAENPSFFSSFHRPFMEPDFFLGGG